MEGGALGDGAEVGGRGEGELLGEETELGLSSANSCFSFFFPRFNFYERGCHLKSNHFKENTNNSIKERFSI